MSAYTTITKVIATMPGGAPLSEMTRPSLSDGTALITTVSAQVDAAYLQAGATLPIALTETEILAVLDVRVAREVCYSIMTARGAWAPGTTTPYWAKWHDEFEAMLKAIRNREDLVLPEGDSGSGRAWSYTMDFMDGSTDDEAKGPKIERSQQW